MNKSIDKEKLFADLDKWYENATPEEIEEIRKETAVWDCTLMDGLSDAVDCMIISEEVLGKEWNTPEEDEAWKDL
jgi:hypothetical protein